MNDAVLEKQADENNDMLIQFINEGYIISDNGRLSANFPVFTEAVFENDVRNLLKPIYETVRDCMLESCEQAAAIVKNHAPKALHAKCGQAATFHYQNYVLAFIVENMVAQGFLKLPQPDEKPCVFGVKR